MIVRLAGLAVLFLGGLVLALLGHHFGARAQSFNRRAIATCGTVIGHTRFQFPRGDHLVPKTEARIRFRANDGRDHETKGFGQDEARPPQPPVGAIVQVLYDPLDPRETSTRGPRGEAGIARALFWSGVGLAACAVLLGALLVVVTAA